jgi:hypothetical protein
MMTPSTPKSCVLLASNAPVAMILYRKSHLTTYCLHLDYEQRHKRHIYKLTRGSRFYGRLFPHRCHLSPDGSMLVYFAMRGRKTGETSDPATWTAVCTPPWLKAHLLFPNGSTWGGGGMFLRDHRLIVFDKPPVGAGPEYKQFRGYEIIRDVKTLPEKDVALVMARFKPPQETRLPWPIKPDRITSPVLVRNTKKHSPDNYDYYDYSLQDGTGRKVAGAEEIARANWAGWDAYGRLMVVTGQDLKIFELQHGKFAGKPIKTLDLEAVIA